MLVFFPQLLKDGSHTVWWDIKAWTFNSCCVTPKTSSAKPIINLIITVIKHITLHLPIYRELINNEEFQVSKWKTCTYMHVIYRCIILLYKYVSTTRIVLELIMIFHFIWPGKRDYIAISLIHNVPLTYPI